MARFSNIAMLLLCTVLVLAGCGKGDSDYDRGYGDGVTVGYNLACPGYEGNLIHGDWESADYSRGYADGMEDGIKDCRRERGD